MLLRSSLLLQQMSWWSSVECSSPGPKPIPYFG